MKAILRKWKDNQYVVKEVSIDDKARIICDGSVVHEVNVLTILEKENSNFVRCSMCGEIIPNNKKDIKVHINRAKDHEGCFGCESLTAEVVHDEKNKASYKLSEDGTFERKLSDKVRLYCCYAYGNRDITNKCESGFCRYRRCTEETLESIKTFFDKYPNAFDSMITVDAIEGFKEINEYYNDTYLRLKCRGTIYAVANKKGIIDHFRIHTRHSVFDIYYSKKYNKLFKENGGKYMELASNWELSNDRIDYFLKTFAKLYK